MVVPYTLIGNKRQKIRVMYLNLVLLSELYNLNLTILKKILQFINYCNCNLLVLEYLKWGKSM